MAEPRPIILAGAWDGPVRALAHRWAAAGAVVLTPFDLSREGWQYWPGKPDHVRATIGGRVLGTAAIGSILVRLPCVTAEDLPHIAIADRIYVAEEMTAFLLAWLTELPCRVVNRPTATCLAGPAWRDEQWVRLAWRCGIPSRPTLRRIASAGARTAEDPPLLTTVTVVGARTLGDAHPLLVQYAGTLAAAAGAEILAVHFDGASADARFVRAGPWPDVERDDVADALLDLLATDPEGVRARAARGPA